MDGRTRRCLSLTLTLAFGVVAEAGERRGSWQNPRPVEAVNRANHSELQSPISPNNLEIFFGSFPVDEGGGFDIWVARRDDAAGEFRSPEKLDVLNSEHNDYPSWVSADGLELYLFSNRFSPKPPGTHDIFVARRESINSPFAAPEPIIELNTAAHEGTSTLSADGSEMVFVSNRAGSTGARDLWLARRERRGDAWDSWEVIRNLTEINTAERERSPALSRDARTLFFDRFPRGGVAQLWCADLDPNTDRFVNARALTNLNSPAFNGVPSVSSDWPADGAEIYWSRCFGSECDLYVATWSVPQSDFVRGECNDDGTINLSDGIFSLNALFAGAEQPDCVEACDVNDDGLWGISDAVYLFNYLFAGGTVPEAPFPDCGVDPSQDGGLDCDRKLCE